MKIKDTEIHNGFESKDIRDLLAKIIVDYAWTKKPEFNQSLTGLDQSLDIAEKTIKFWEAEKERIKIFQAVREIYSLFNWDEFDVSNFVIKTGKTWRNFFGTNEEYLELCKKLNVDPNV